MPVHDCRKTPSPICSVSPTVALSNTFSNQKRQVLCPKPKPWSRTLGPPCRPAFYACTLAVHHRPASLALTLEACTPGFHAGALQLRTVPLSHTLGPHPEPTSYACTVCLHPGPAPFACILCLNPGPLPYDMPAPYASILVLYPWPPLWRVPWALAPKAYTYTLGLHSRPAFLACTLDRSPWHALLVRPLGMHPRAVPLLAHPRSLLPSLGPLAPASQPAPSACTQACSTSTTQVWHLSLQPRPATSACNLGLHPGPAALEPAS